MSARARDEPRLADSLALSVVLSSSIMFVRMGILIAVAGPRLLRLAWLPLAVMSAAGLLVSLWFYRRSPATCRVIEEGPRLRREVPYAGRDELDRLGRRLELRQQPHHQRRSSARSASDNRSVRSTRGALTLESAMAEVGLES
jgi:hypothetical protein